MPELLVHSSIRDIDADAWNALAGSEQPFVRHGFLSALEDSGSLRRELGWAPMPLLLREGKEIVAAAPGYLKTNSHGEFVFDWAWADAYARSGLNYYPKLLIAVPYSPVTGPRLLGAERGRLAASIRQLVDRSKLSSAHLNFLTEPDAAALAHDPWLPRFDWQFHLRNPGYRDFQDFLDALSSKKRKNIRQERGHAQRHGFDIVWKKDVDLDEADLDAIHALYSDTFDRKGNTPALTRAFFSLLRERVPGALHVAGAWRDRRLHAVAVFMRGTHTLYGRYWGADADYAGLHFELCYYQGIEHLIANRMRTFEPGAQGEHKIARGFLPTRTRSAHYIRHPGFRTAIRSALDREAQSLRHYRAELDAHSPYARTEG